MLATCTNVDFNNQLIPFSPNFVNVIVLLWFALVVPVLSIEVIHVHTPVLLNSCGYC